MLGLMRVEFDHGEKARGQTSESKASWVLKVNATATAIAIADPLSFGSSCSSLPKIQIKQQHRTWNLAGRECAVWSLRFPSLAKNGFCDKK